LLVIKKNRKMLWIAVQSCLMNEEIILVIIWISF
jgi:hypothetical protein